MRVYIRVSVEWPGLCSRICREQQNNPWVFRSRIVARNCQNKREECLLCGDRSGSSKKGIPEMVSPLS